jgi:hypothetical protein
MDTMQLVVKTYTWKRERSVKPSFKNKFESKGVDPKPGRKGKKRGKGEKEGKRKFSSARGS